MLRIRAAIHAVTMEPMEPMEAMEPGWTRAPFQACSRSNRSSRIWCSASSSLTEDLRKIRSQMGLGMGYTPKQSHFMGNMKNEFPEASCCFHPNVFWLWVEHVFWLCIERTILSRIGQSTQFWAGVETTTSSIAIFRAMLCIWFMPHLETVWAQPQIIQSTLGYLNQNVTQPWANMVGWWWMDPRSCCFHPLFLLWRKNHSYVYSHDYIYIYTYYVIQNTSTFFYWLVSTSSPIMD